MEELQQTLIRQLNLGILASTSSDSTQDPNQADTLIRHKNALPLEDPITSTCIPEAWARASMLVRVNSLIQGFSGVRPVVVQGIVNLLHQNIVPRIPLRGSISASGDLMPLSYVGGALQGKPSITVWTGKAKDRRIVRADVALAEAKLEPIHLGPKEGLAIINGTAVSTGVAALAMQDANGLTVLSQVLTAMSVEALIGTSESFEPVLARVRPHPGQIESAHNIFNFLDGSKLAKDNDGLEAGSLRQDRYSIRTASQWIGPILEDFQLANQQITIECNSVTDNPLIDVETTRVLNGGNFQAKAITSAMDKTRYGLQTIGQMLYVQCTEIINPRTNNGLPPNLVADEPSQSFLFKPLDIMIAALQSELGFLSHPAGVYVQPAEMGNQALNSLALISGRYSHMALAVLSQLCAAHLFALCQALDLRAMHRRYSESYKPRFYTETLAMLDKVFSKPDERRSVCDLLWRQFLKRLDETTTMDSAARFAAVFQTLQSTVLSSESFAAAGVSTLKAWTSKSSSSALDAFGANIDQYSASPDATPFLGTASRRMYTFVRKELSVPFLRADKKMMAPEVSVGALVTSIYTSIRNGSAFGPAMECLRDASKKGYPEYTFSAKL